MVECSIVNPKIRLEKLHTVKVEETIPTISACKVSLMNSSSIAFCNTSFLLYVSLINLSVVLMFSSQGGRPLGIVKLQ